MDRVNRMWGRMAPRPKSSRDSAVPSTMISGPTLVESTIDHDVLQNMMDISSHQPDSPYRRENRADHFGVGHDQQTASRIAVQPTTLASTYSKSRSSKLRTNRRPIPSSVYGDVSPPDSPDMLAVQSPGDGDVSPIEHVEDDEVHPAFRSNAKVASQIPVAKRVAANEVRMTNRAYKRDPSAPLKWDKYTGEPTTSVKGLPSGVKPTQVVKGFEQTRGKPKQPEGFVDENDTTASRPPWKGASGRTATVQPVHAKANPTTFNAAGILTPPQSMSPTGDRDEIDHDHHHAQHAHNLNSMSTSRAVTGYPSPPLGKHDIGGTPPTSQGNDMAAEASPPIRKSSRADGHARGGRKGNSRFSWTTLTTNTNYQHSPPPSPPPALPATVESIMDRMRPVKSNRNYSPNSGSPIVPDAPPFASYRSVSGKVTRPSSGESDYAAASDSDAPEKLHAPSMMSTTFGGGKALPATPQQLESRDHISQLEAQLADLHLQRSNIERVLRDMTRPTATHALMTNFLVEREREKRVSALRDELHSIGMLEHALGLQLHRANRRKERVEGYEGFTTLWVRRATGLSTDP